MILVLLLAIPFAAALIVLTCKRPRRAVRVAISAGALEAAAIADAVWNIRAAGVLQLGHYLRADGLTAFFLLNIGLILALVLVYSIGYLRHIPAGRFSSPRWFYSLTFLFVFTMMAVYLSANLGMLWICVEATTLASALLVGFYNTKGAVEAGWKYLVVCTVGIAFALFGTIALYLAAVKSGVDPASALDWGALMNAAPGLAATRDLVKLSFVFVAVGYGTKIGFVPMHSWLPDAHAEAPTPISAMLSAVAVELRPLCFAALRHHYVACHRQRVQPHAAVDLRRAVGWSGGAADGGTARPEAATGLQQHRAHGHCGHRHRARRAAGTVWSSSPHFQSIQ